MTSHTTTGPQIAVSYLRVSTTRQMNTGADIDAEGNSIATQREANNAKAARMGALIEKEFVEPGASAQTIDKRPVFKQLLAYLGENPDVSLVIIYMRSRAFRNLGDAVITKRRLEAMGVKLVSAKEDFGEGIMADAMEAVTDIINEVQVRMSGEDIKVKMRHKAQMGGTNGRAPIGYRNVRIEHDGRQVNGIAVDEERAPLIRQAFEMYATGDYSIDRLQEAMADLGLKSRPQGRSAATELSRSHLHRMLSDPYYIGIVRYKGETFPGRHQPIIPADLFERVQKVIEDRSARGQRDRVLYHYLKGLLYCERCRANGRTSRLVYTEAKGNGGNYAYYLCLARQRGECDLPHLPVLDVEWYVLDHYAKLGLPPKFLDYIREAIDVAMADAQARVRDLYTAYRKKLDKLAQQEERLIDLASDGELAPDKIRARLRKIQVERTRAQQGLDDTGDQLELGARKLQQYLDLLDDPQALYLRAPEDGRRDLNTASFSKLWLDDDGVVTDELTPAIHELRDAARAFTRWQDVDAVGRDVEALHVSDVLKNQKLPGDSGESGLNLGFRLADMFRVGSSKNVLVPPVGLEPTLCGF
ncbi:recombinase family protein [Gordonia sputi]|uniref:recombinase family protein n=1 Tax=Gordonia sputi TaxID=36823 RepID=UPI002043FF1B|nr:recombinase family protein [Gordonia sputi]MCM3897868.1 recombinase family protein [Gordonia sputi]